MKLLSLIDRTLKLTEDLSKVMKVVDNCLAEVSLLEDKSKSLKLVKRNVC
jgi:hypothetical protein